MRIQAVQDKSEIPDIAYVKVMLKRLHLHDKHHMISSSDSKVRTTLNVSITHSTLGVKEIKRC